MGIQKDKLSEAQKQEIERLRQFVARNRLDARMNGTKWRAAIDTVMALEGYNPSFRVKAVTDAVEPPPGQWNGAFPEAIPLYNSIEWLELNPFAEVPYGAAGSSRPPGAAGAAATTGAAEAAGSVAGFGKDHKGKPKRPDFREALKGALSAAGIPIEETPTGIRIIGYSRSGAGRK
ncbi:MAG: hypothetical protein JWP91_871 [Fibrobacteres bacterium]|nr:hypothetical protein [Fibrobacterota bacterium]